MADTADNNMMIAACNALLTGQNHAALNSLKLALTTFAIDDPDLPGLFSEALIETAFTQTKSILPKSGESVSPERFLPLTSLTKSEKEAVLNKMGALVKNYMVGVFMLPLEYQVDTVIGFNHLNITPAEKDVHFIFMQQFMRDMAENVENPESGYHALIEANNIRARANRTKLPDSENKEPDVGGFYDI